MRVSVSVFVRACVSVRANVCALVVAADVAVQGHHNEEHRAGVQENVPRQRARPRVCVCVRVCTCLCVGENEEGMGCL